MAKVLDFAHADKRILNLVGGDIRDIGRDGIGGLCLLCKARGGGALFWQGHERLIVHIGIGIGIYLFCAFRALANMRLPRFGSAESLPFSLRRRGHSIAFPLLRVLADELCLVVVSLEGVAELIIFMMWDCRLHG